MTGLNSEVSMGEFIVGKGIMCDGALPLDEARKVREGSAGAKEAFLRGGRRRAVGGCGVRW